MYVSLFSDHEIIFVNAVFGICQFSIGLELKFQEFVAEFALVTDVITQIKVTLHAFRDQTLTAIHQSVLQGQFSYK